MKKFPFAEPPNTYIFTCEHVLDNTADICRVLHEEDGDWQFLCKANKHTLAESRVIRFKEILDFDFSVSELSNMPSNYMAERKDKTHSWEITKLSPKFSALYEFINEDK